MRDRTFRWRKHVHRDCLHLVVKGRNTPICSPFSFPRSWPNHGVYEQYMDYNYTQPLVICQLCHMLAVEQYGEHYLKFMRNWTEAKEAIAKGRKQNSPTREISRPSVHGQQRQQKETPMPNSLNAVVNGATNNWKQVKRASLSVGDLFKNRKDGKTYMHTGVRTQPPSGSTAEVTVAGQRVGTFRTQATIAYTAAGKEVIGFQSIVVAPNARGEGVKAGEDGAIVSFENTNVYLVGKAKINLELI